MALRIRLQGRPDIERYLGGALAHAPFGTNSPLRHIVGGDEGGAVKWFPAPGSDVPGASPLSRSTPAPASAGSPLSTTTASCRPGRRSLAWGTQERVVAPGSRSGGRRASGREASLEVGWRSDETRPAPELTSE